jgi:hypothetical protein
VEVVGQTCFTIRQAAERTGASESRLYRMRARGQFLNARKPLDGSEKAGWISPVTDLIARDLVPNIAEQRTPQEAV